MCVHAYCVRNMCCVMCGVTCGATCGAVSGIEMDRYSYIYIYIFAVGLLQFAMV